MSKSKSHTNQEDLRGQNRLLNKQVKLLRKEVALLRKKLQKYEGYVDGFTYERDVEEVVYQPKEDQCTQCSRGTLVTTDIGVRKIISCNGCGFREVIKV